ncbi:hypothetical protein Syun_028334 [Stephania yunnanensis]|uniref:Uncharacterized protein n=1 Tax=Stephania yunnanensis TaxID=152371 RepID=A0AAP0EMS9_9MAGN
MHIQSTQPPTMPSQSSTLFFIPMPIAGTQSSKPTFPLCPSESPSSTAANSLKQPLMTTHSRPSSSAV